MNLDFEPISNEELNQDQQVQGRQSRINRPNNAYMRIILSLIILMAIYMITNKIKDKAIRKEKAKIRQAQEQHIKLHLNDIPEAQNYYNTIQNKTILFSMLEKQSIEICLAVNVNGHYNLQNSQKIPPHKGLFYFGNNDLANAFEEELKKSSFSYKRIEYDIDSSYKFIKQPTQDCEKIIFFDSSVILNTFITKQSLEKNTFKSSHLLFSSQTTKDSEKIQLKDLAHQDISEIPEDELKQHIFIISKGLLNALSPLNFAYNNFYTFYELIIYPAIALTQNSHAIQAIPDVQYEIIEHERNYNSTEYDLLDKPQASDDHICFVAYPTNCTGNNISQSIRYLQTFEGNSDMKDFSIVMTVLYQKGGNVFELVEKVLELQREKNISITLRIRHLKAHPAVQVYEASFTYCPQDSFFFTSRINIKPILNVTKQVVNEAKQTPFQIFIFNKGQDTIQNRKHLISSTLQQIKQRALQYFNETYLKDAQLFHSSHFRRIKFYAFKWKQLEFYQNQLCFFIPMIRYQQNIKFVSKQLWEKYENRSLSEQQKEQLKGLKLKRLLLQFKRYLKYNCLNNKGFKKNAHEVIPRIIHQIWLSYADKPSVEKIMLADTVKKWHPDFEYKLWTFKDLNQQNFPLSFFVIDRLLKIQRNGKGNYRSQIAGVMRIQLLYRYGGIYLDYKIDMFKSMAPFLKYEQFFLFVSPKKANQKGQQVGSLVNGVIGSIRGFRHFKTILTEVFPKTVRQVKKGFQNSTGAVALATPYNQKEMITQVVDISFLTINSRRVCLNRRDTEIDETKQTIFKGKSTLATHYYVAIPCQLFTQQYFEIYYVFGRTRTGNEADHPFKL